MTETVAEDQTDINSIEENKEEEIVNYEEIKPFIEETIEEKDTEETEVIDSDEENTDEDSEEN